jgi:hypothetical protein
MGPDQRMLMGRVRDSLTQRPVAGARVLLTTAAHVAGSQLGEATLQTITTDSLGIYAACGVPINQRVTVHALAPERSSRFVSLQFGEQEVTVGRRDRVPLASDIWNQDLVLHDSRTTVIPVSGVVTEAGTGQPVRDAIVQVLGAGSTAKTDSAGAFAFSGIVAGDHRLAVRRVGYAASDFAFAIPAGRPVHLPPGQLELEPIPTALDPIVVEADLYENRKLAGFFQRRERGMGDFITRAEFAQLSPAHTTDILRLVPAIRVRANPNYYRRKEDGTLDTRRFVVESARIGSPFVWEEECPAIVYVDGNYYGTTLDEDIDQLVFASDIDAIEAYHGGQVPPRFNIRGSSCGVILIWTQ